jgi:prepilin-type N-terminal cleavage/methylation domain-containing protein
MGILWLLYLNLALAMFLAPGSFYIMIIVYMAAIWLPKHRSLGDFWRPAALTSRRLMRRGTTLIELLIVVAIVAILMAGLAQTTSVMSHAARRQAELRESVRLAEDQFALLRAGGALPAAGRHPVDASLREIYAVAALAEFEVRPGPSPRLREVRVIVHLSGAQTPGDVEMAALLPAGSE